MRASVELALKSLLVIPSLNLPDIPSESCLAKSYYGTYGSSGVFLPEFSCAVDSVTSLALGEGSITEVPNDVTELVWVEQVKMEEELLARMQFGGADPWALTDRLPPKFIIPSEEDCDLDSDESVLFSQDSAMYSMMEGYDEPKDMLLLHRTNTSSLFGLRGYTTQYFSIDDLIQPYHKATVLPLTPFPMAPVSPDNVATVRQVLSGLKYDKEVASILNNISLPQMKETIEWLTGEAEDSPIESRNSFHPDTRIAAQWIQDQIETTGAKCEQRPFLLGYAPNVICRYNSTVNTTATVLFSAHYDSRGSFGRTRAPGGDDDGSGTTSIINIAHAIARSGVQFKSNVELVLFAGEEQGLLGSRAYSRELKEADANITVMVQADMLAYHKPGEEPQLGLPQYIGSPEVAQLVGNISGLYSPELKVGFTAACCSDHQSFHVLGYPATQVFERAGPIADPMYHNSGDLSNREGYDLEQVRSIAKVQLATLLHVAGFEFP